MNNNRVLQMVGLATKAGKTVSGEFSTQKAITDRKAKLVIVALDASDNTKKLFRNKSSFYKNPIMFYSSKIELGRITGHETRTSIAIVDNGFAKSIIEKAKLENVTVNP